MEVWELLGYSNVWEQVEGVLAASVNRALGQRGPGEEPRVGGCYPLWSWPVLTNNTKPKKRVLGSKAGSTPNS